MCAESLSITVTPAPRAETKVPGQVGHRAPAANPPDRMLDTAETLVRKFASLGLISRVSTPPTPCAPLTTVAPFAAVTAPMATRAPAHAERTEVASATEETNTTILEAAACADSRAVSELIVPPPQSTPSSLDPHRYAASSHPVRAGTGPPPPT